MRGRRKSGFKKFIEGCQNLDEGTKRGIFIIFLFVVGGVSFLSLFSLAGKLGIWLNGVLMSGFGCARFIIPLTLLILSYLLLYPDKYEVRNSNYFGIFLLGISFPCLIHVSKIIYYSYWLEEILMLEQGGGYVGTLSVHLINLAGTAVSFIVFASIFLVSILLTFNTSIWTVKEKVLLITWPYKKIKQFVGWWRWRRKNVKEEEADGCETDMEKEISDHKETGDLNKQKLEIGNWKLDDGHQDVENENDEKREQQELIPKKLYKKIDLPFDLLDDQAGKPTSGDIKSIGETIRRTLESFGIEVEMGEVNVGPTVTQYTLKPSEGIKLSQITTLHNDLALALAAHPIRVEAPIPGKALVGIEVPNQKIAIVGLKEILQSREFKTRKSNLMLALGKDVSGRPCLADLTRMPHLLIAGSTGSGKTICINAILMSLLYQNTPETLKLILVDPKRVELTLYNNINFLIAPVITDVKKTVNALRWAICEMERRFETLSNARKRDIESYNTEAKEKMPYIVIIIDELADLMSTSGAEVEAAIIRLAQMARAVGIHLILATQRPSVNVITGLIKANIPARIAFSVASLTDSRTILDCSGAEKLLGRGDMLLLSAEISKPKRLQGAFISEMETKRVARFIKENSPEELMYDDNVVESKHKVMGVSSGDEDEDEELLEEAKSIVNSAGRASTSLLQRRLKIGYSRAARLIDIMEEQGIVGPAEGSKPREVIRQ
ncbi:MAG: DNA translocase FtsK 4TM domain-containing protein [bacterium]